MASVAYLALSATHVAAQNAPDARTQSATEETQAGVAEIVVTAQRRSESLQDVPVSVVAVTSESLEARNIQDVRQLYLAAPSLQLSGGNDRDSAFYIRGVGTLALVPTVENSVAVAVDDINLGRANLAFGAFDDVARVEALSGPQGLLFGKNASAGLLHIITNRPRIGAFEAKIDGEVAFRDTVGHSSFGELIRGVINLPVGTKSALRITGRYSHQDSIIRSTRPENGTGNAESYGFRVKFLTQPTDNFELYLIGEYGKRTGLPLASYRQTAPTGEITPVLAANGIVAGERNFVGGTDGLTTSDDDMYGIQGTLTYTLPNDWELIAVFGYKHLTTLGLLDTDRTTSNFLSLSRADDTYSQFSGELRLALPATGRVNGQVGLYYYKSDAEMQRDLGGLQGRTLTGAQVFPFCVGAQPPFGTPPRCARSNDFVNGRDVRTDYSNESYAAFGQLNFELTDSLTLIGGARVTHDNVAIDNVQQQLNYFISLADRGTFSGRASNTNFSYKVGAQYDVSRDIMLYGYYAKGYKGPGFNDVFAAGVTPLVNAETTDSFEAGIKSSWLNGKVVVNISAFLQKFYDYQAQAFVVDRQTFELRNAAELESKGIEAQISLRPVRGLTVNANATVLDATYASFPGAQCAPGQVDCAANGTFDASGLRLPGSAKFSSTVQARYSFPVTGDATGFVDANWYHRTPINFELVSPTLTEIGTVDQVGASIGLETDRVRFSLFCRNCFDQVRPTLVRLWAGDARNRLPTAFQTFDINSVRNIGITASYKF